ncbi:hypothetical protein MMC12_007598 [Toensbergia leucococca]|nr:hypothetical protein [Toensbergia leucococca]
MRMYQGSEFGVDNQRALGYRPSFLVGAKLSLLKIYILRKLLQQVSQGPIATPASGATTAGLTPTSVSSITDTIQNSVVKTQGTSSTALTFLPSTTQTQGESPTSENSNGGSGSDGLSKGGEIALATVIPVVTLFFMILFGILENRRRGRKRREKAARDHELHQMAMGGGRIGGMHNDGRMDVGGHMIGNNGRHIHNHYYN